jgi:group I intron endonuclease
MVGIYKITNLLNNMVYIGSSSHIEDRKEYHFRFGKTYNDKRINKLYNDMYTFGIDNFTFEILCECKLSELEEKEQEEINKYDKNLLYNTVKKVCKVARGEKASRAKLSEEQVLEIYKLLKENILSDREIAKRYNICFNAISEINHGITYKHENMSYPIRVFKQKGARRIFSDDEVKQYREEYNNNGHQSKILYDKYNIQCSYSAFRQMLTRKTYKEIN